MLWSDEMRHAIDSIGRMGSAIALRQGLFIGSVSCRNPSLVISLSYVARSRVRCDASPWGILPANRIDNLLPHRWQSAASP